MDHCDACGFVYADVPRAEIAAAVRALAADYGRRLAPAGAGGPDVEHDLRLRAHPLAGVWSALEYACHVRDVLTVQRERVRRAQLEDVPVAEPMGREERVTRDRYNEQAPATVAIELEAAARALAGELDGLDDRGWERRSVYTWPTREERDVEWIGRHTIHELRHHLDDVDALLAVKP